MFDLSGKVAVVTGAGQGMGVGMARALAAAGASVAVNDLYPERAEVTSAAIAADEGRAIAAPFDVTDVDAVRAGVARIVDELGPVDILVNNAGIPQEMHGTKLFKDSQPADWRPVIELNIFGSLNCVHVVLPSMLERKSGRIIQISSGSGRRGVPFGVSLYGASKSGIEGFVRHFAQELGASGVTVNVLAFGLMNNAVPSGDNELLQNLARSIPLGRLGTPEDAGAFCVFLASDESGYVHGQTFNLNGGQFSN